ncbi:hypothetical protein A9G09_02550 [Gilliamella sp. wkB292]|uniref:hypothetical protein n=2 Tax=unclassified Gilliamella TaxID=2685620 RepID=UPI00080E5525|nr:hypothetical protein [Gilliamella apicola]OCG16684.1 hypothetical protein A9G09_02550 [Gilliamella apicola]
MVLIGHRASGIGHRASGIGHRASGIGHRASGLSQLESKHRLSVLALLQNILPFTLVKSSIHFFDVFSSKFFNLYFSIAKIKLIIVILFMSLFLQPNAYGLTSTTVQNIIGNAPKVANVKEASDKHGFTVKNVFYSEASGNITSDVVKRFDGNLRFSDFVVKMYYYNNLSSITNFSDIDGDKADPIKPFLLTVTSSQWYDGKGNKIPNSDLNNIIGCGSGYVMPLTLEISAALKTYSQYGIPNESDSVTLTKKYKIAPESMICYAKSNDIVLSPKMQWRTYDETITSPVSGPWEWNGSKGTPDAVHGGGYTADYVPNYGFKAQPTVSAKTFPTTGFPGAKFQLVMTGAQTDYTYTLISNPGGKVAVDSLGFITLNDKPTGNVTVRATLGYDKSISHDYTFNPTSVWLVPVKSGDINQATAQNLCGGLANVPSRRDYTNSPANSVGVNWTVYTNSFIRAIGSSIMGEWGLVVGTNYPNSNWETENTYFSYYWTRELDWSAYNIYFIVNFSGYVSHMEAPNSSGGRVACKR